VGNCTISAIKAGVGTRYGIYIGQAAVPITNAVPFLLVNSIVHDCDNGVHVQNPVGHNVILVNTLFHGNNVNTVNSPFEIGTIPGDPDPLFVSPGAADYDYRLQVDSPARGVGYLSEDALPPEYMDLGALQRELVRRVGCGRGFVRGSA